MEGINMLLRDTYKQILALTNKHKTIKVHMRRWEDQLVLTAITEPAANILKTNSTTTFEIGSEIIFHFIFHFLSFSKWMETEFRFN